MAIVQTGEGLAVDSSTFAVVTTNDATGAKMIAGFLVSPDGKLVVTYA